jgi:hypothetical protein
MIGVFFFLLLIYRVTARKNVTMMMGMNVSHGMMAGMNATGMMGMNMSCMGSKSMESKSRRLFGDEEGRSYGHYNANKTVYTVNLLV